MSHTREASLPSQAWPAFRILGGYGVPTEINGPYRNLPAPNEVAPGNTFHCAKINNVEQWEVILQANRAANDGGIRSDLAGFTYPCKDSCGKQTICTEPEFLKEPGAKHRLCVPDMDAASANVPPTCCPATMVQRHAWP